MLKLEFEIIQKANIYLPTDDVDEAIKMAIDAVNSDEVIVLKKECDNFVYDTEVQGIPMSVLQKCFVTDEAVDPKSISVVASTHIPDLESSAY